MTGNILLLGRSFSFRKIPATYVLETFSGILRPVNASEAAFQYTIQHFSLSSSALSIIQ